MSVFSKTHQHTIDVYQKHAGEWDKQRPRLLREEKWLSKFTQSLASGSLILDVGCGAGEPISRYLVEQGFSVTGVDASPAMIDICKTRFPDEEWLVMDMRHLTLEKKFDGIVAWDSFFHLNQEEQREALTCFAQLLRPGGRMLLTVGHEAGEALGTVAGEAVYHSSLSAQEYKHILSAAGLQETEMVCKDQSCDRTVLLAR